MLRSACIYTEPRPEDGLRVSIMSRHTENDGETPDLRIVEGISYIKWWKELAPLDNTVGRYYGDRIDFEGLRDEYFERLCSDPFSISRVRQLIRIAEEEDVTVLCKEPTEMARKCHRSLLLDFCLDISPGLEIDVQ